MATLAELMIKNRIAEKIKENLGIEVKHTDISRLYGGGKNYQIFAVQSDNKTILVWQYTTGGFKMKEIEW